MLRANHLALLRCPSCSGEPLDHRALQVGSNGELLEGIVWCRSCRMWYPVEDGVLDLLLGELAYAQDRERFRERHAAAFAALDLPPTPVAAGPAKLQSVQQAHFDWYATNTKQSYLAYEQMPFWRCVDALTFEAWKGQLNPGSLLLDVGCGNGRSTFKLMDLDLEILAFDVSKEAIRQALRRQREGRFAARAVFFVADATRFPLRTAAMDYVLVYGVLHHVPDPHVACREIARVLRPGGRYFGSENNETVFRRAFELLQRLWPIWYEEAGPEALISERTLTENFSDTDVRVRTRTFVFVPPHLVNLLPLRVGRGLLELTDRVGGVLPWIRSNGGLILIEGIKSPSASA